MLDVVTRATKPILFLDVDGAVCPYATPEGATVERIWGLQMPIVPENRERLAILNSLYEITWCTDWEEHANLVGEAFELPPLPHVPISRISADVVPSYEVPDPTERLDYAWQTHELTHPEDLDDPRGSGSPSMFEKVLAVADYLEEARSTARRLAWVDDHINYEARLFAQSWPAETLLIRTSRDVGLTEEIVEKLCAFAAADFGRTQESET